MSKETLALFGVAGNPPNFWQSNLSKERANSPEWLSSIGLDALEIQCTYGVRMPKERALLFKQNAKQFGIRLSIHGPYYISLGTSSPEKIDRSLNEIAKAVELAKTIDCNRIVFHLGGIEKDRNTARAHAISSLRRFEKEFDLGSVRLFPEIAGKAGQLGSLEDVLEICSEVSSAWPCLDLAHLHARDRGSLRTKSDFEAVLELVEQRLGKEALEHLHVHLYPIEWNASGEVTHRAFDDEVLTSDQPSLFNMEDEDKVFLPRYEPFIELMVERQLKPIIICEAKDSQDVGALRMKGFYQSLLSKTT